MKHVYKD